jgi:hypothetical protein
VPSAFSHRTALSIAQLARKPARASGVCASFAGGADKEAVRSAPAPEPLFDELAGLDAAELSTWLMRDIGRRRAELIALGWLGRIFLLVESVVPGALAVFWPRLWVLKPYEGEGDSLAYETRADGARAHSTLEIVLAETSVVPRGVPLRLRITRAASGEVTHAVLVAVGCDIAPIWPAGSRALDDGEARSQCARLNADRAAKRLMVRAVETGVFAHILPALSAPAEGSPLALEPCGPVQLFTPRRDLYAREGTADKWLQRVSAYYFAESKLREVRVVGRPGARFTFYLDPSEPCNSIDRRRNVNPEVLCCKLEAYDH